MKTDTRGQIVKMLGSMFPEFEIAAFRYELARRHKPKGILPFTKLAEMDIHTVWGRFKHQEKWAAVNHIGAVTMQATGYTFPTVQWNLDASDNALTKEFMARIRAARSSRGVETPKKNSGNRNRGVSWHWLNLMDEPKGLDECDRSHLSQARREAERLFPILLETVTEIQRNHEFLERNPDPHYSNRPFRHKE